jgi:hypothetical protein
MNAANELLSKIETARLWSYFHKDWLLQIRQALRELDLKAVHNLEVRGAT